MSVSEGSLAIDVLLDPAASYSSPKLEVRSYLAKGGYGLFCRESIRRGELLIVWGGQPINGAELAELPETTLNHTVQIDEDLFLAPAGPPDPGDFINHSCEPNVGMLTGKALVAMRDIAPDEEVCYDYAMSDGTDYWMFDCRCGSRLCRGLISGGDWQRPELWDRYRGFFSPYLTRRIEALRGEP